MKTTKLKQRREAIRALNSMSKLALDMCGAYPEYIEMRKKIRKDKRLIQSFIK